MLAQVLLDAFANTEIDGMNVANGLEVMETTKKFAPHAILLDLILPGLDGFAVLEQLKADDKTKNIPVVVISNLGDLGDVKSCLALGAEEYFIKANTQVKKIVDFVKKRI